MSNKTFSLAIHGGAGGSADKAARVEPALRASLDAVLSEGRKLLESGGSALDAVTLCVRLLEDDPLYNAGYGANANAAGEFELDASIMDGQSLKAGAVAAIKGVRNPVTLARAVMEQTPHVMLAADGALSFAKSQNITMAGHDYFREGKEKALEQVEDWLEDTEKENGTVGAVARDIHGNLAAATSTGGHGTKMPGRIGDSPLIGAGNYADNDSAAISCTGIGEHFIRTATAAYAAFLIEREGLGAAEAAQQALNRLAGKVSGDGAFILVDKSGKIAVAQNSSVMRCGWIENGGETVTTLQAPIRVRSR